MPSKSKTKSMGKAKAKALKGGRRLAKPPSTFLGGFGGSKAAQEFGSYSKGFDGPLGNKAQQEFASSNGGKKDIPGSGTKR